MECTKIYYLKTVGVNVNTDITPPTIQKKVVNSRGTLYILYVFPNANSQ